MEITAEYRLPCARCSQTFAIVLFLNHEFRSERTLFLVSCHAKDEADKHADRREAKARGREAREASVVASVAATADPTIETTAAKGGGKPSGRASTSGAKPSGRPSVATSPVEGAAGGGAGDDDAEGSEACTEDGDDINNEGGGFEGESSADAAAAYGDEPWLEPLQLPTPTSGRGEDEVGGATGGTPAVIPEWDRVATAREQGRAHDVVVTGPPLSGKSTLARALASSYRTPALTLDGVIKEAMGMRNTLGARVRAAIHWFTAKEKVRTPLYIIGDCCWCRDQNQNRTMRISQYTAANRRGTNQQTARNYVSL